VAEGLRHGYGNTGPAQTLFQNVNLQVQRGDRIGFIGPNGAGISTLFSCDCALVSTWKMQLHVIFLCKRVFHGTVLIHSTSLLILTFHQALLLLLLLTEGKSTLMRILMNHEEPLEGFSEFATNSIVPAYYAQNQADALDLELTVLETVMQAVHQGKYTYLFACVFVGMVVSE